MPEMDRKTTMKVSILIPVYNWDLSSLLERILKEIDAFALTQSVEVIVMDDSSRDAGLVAGNAAFIARNSRPYLRYRVLERNAGRSAIRNMLAAESAGDFLLFLDCDVLPDRPDFVRTYLSHAEQDRADVVCGGISYRTRVLAGCEFDYHAYLGNKKEVKGASERNMAPWRHVLTSNIMVRKSVFQATPFDERFTGYGYEDIEWGVRLAERFKILHLDNTASHLGLVTKERAYEKMRSSVPNYLLLRTLCPQAFNASAISRLVHLFQCGDSRLLRTLDNVLRRWFLSNRVGNRLAFILFQFNFAVLLALALKEKR